LNSEIVQTGKSQDDYCSESDQVNAYDSTETYMDLEQEIQKRSEDAYRIGIEDGKKLGYEDARNELKESFQSFNNMLNELCMQKDQLLKNAESLLIKLAINIARTLVHQEISVDKKVVGNIVKAALKWADDRNRIHVKVNPSDWEIINSLQKDLKDQLHGIQAFEIKEDAFVSPGGCIIETDSGLIDAQINTQLEEISHRLIESV
jgi:flagellar assembly protein FliH